MPRPRTIHDYLGEFAISDRARAAGLEPAATEQLLREVFTFHGEEGLLFDEHNDEHPVIGTFRDWHAARVLTEFEVAEKQRNYDQNYLQSRMNHLAHAYHQDRLRALLRTPPEIVVAGWEFSDNYLRMARSVLHTLRFWYGRTSIWARLHPLI